MSCFQKLCDIFLCGEGNGAKSGLGMRVSLAKEKWMLNVLKAMMTLPKRL